MEQRARAVRFISGMQASPGQRLGKVGNNFG